MSSFGYPFLFFSFVYFGFLAYLITLGLDSYLLASVPDLASIIGSGDYLTAFLAIISDPLTAYGFISWFSIAIALTDAYIIVSSIT